MWKNLNSFYEKQIVCVFYLLLQQNDRYYDNNNNKIIIIINLVCFFSLIITSFKKKLTFNDLPGVAKGDKTHELVQKFGTKEPGHKYKNRLFSYFSYFVFQLISCI